MMIRRQRVRWAAARAAIVQLEWEADRGRSLYR